MPEAITAPAAIVLVGFMGAGKSRVGVDLARRLRLPFVDTDALIVERNGPIDRIFAEQGETAFRALERDVVIAELEKARRRPCVVALGGGAVTSAQARKALSSVPHVVWLTASPGVLYARACGAGRPLAEDEDGFRRLFERRQESYAAVATVRVSNDGGRVVDDVVEEVLQRCASGQEPA